MRRALLLVGLLVLAGCAAQKPEPGATVQTDFTTSTSVGVSVSEPPPGVLAEAPEWKAGWSFTYEWDETYRRSFGAVVDGETRDYGYNGGGQSSSGPFTRFVLTNDIATLGQGALVGNEAFSPWTSIVYAQNLTTDVVSVSPFCNSACDDPVEEAWIAPQTWFSTPWDRHDLVRFPMHEGDEWETAIDVSQGNMAQAVDLVGKGVIRATVMAPEPVETPLGKLEAIPIVHRITLDDESLAATLVGSADDGETRQDSVLKVWYAPSIQNIVRTDLRLDMEGHVPTANGYKIVHITSSGGRNLTSASFETVPQRPLLEQLSAMRQPVPPATFDRERFELPSDDEVTVTAIRHPVWSQAVVRLSAHGLTDPVTPNEGTLAIKPTRSGYVTIRAVPLTPSGYEYDDFAAMSYLPVDFLTTETVDCPVGQDQAATCPPLAVPVGGGTARLHVVATTAGTIPFEGRLVVDGPAEYASVSEAGKAEIDVADAPAGDYVVRFERDLGLPTQTVTYVVQALGEVPSTSS